MGEVEIARIQPVRAGPSGHGNCYQWEEMGRPMGFEPTTSGTTNRRSNQLSYDRHMSRPFAKKAPDWKEKNRRTVHLLAACPPAYTI